MFLAALKLKNIRISPISTYHPAGDVWNKDSPFVRVVSVNEEDLITAQGKTHIK